MKEKVDIKEKHRERKKEAHEKLLSRERSALLLSPIDMARIAIRLNLDEGIDLGIFEHIRKNIHDKMGAVSRRKKSALEKEMYASAQHYQMQLLPLQSALETVEQVWVEFMEEKMAGA